MDQLLTTKLYIPPLRSELVPRPRLFERLNEGANRKLILISAPAGFGKSTMVSGWLAARDVQAAWLSLDRSDNDPARFWTYLIAAIQTIHHEVGADARQIASSPQLRSIEPVAISLINDISLLDQDLIVVLDDYHVIEAGQVHASLSYLLDHQPPQLHLILITRADPSISLARLRANGRLIEIRARDLQFSADEAAILLNDVIRLNLNLDQVEALNRRTEGWIVGLNLAALYLKGQPGPESLIDRFTGSHQFILDYLTEEVLEALPEVSRQFLLRTSILDRFCARLCSAVTGNTDSRQVLNEFRSVSLFLIPLDAGEIWFRFHHLFAEVLYTLLERDYPGEINDLHLKAATWFESEGYAGEAVDHALRSGDFDLGRELVLKHTLPFIHRGEVATVMRWLDALPDDRDRADPSVPLARCWALFLSGKSSAIEPHLERAEIAYERLLGEGSLSGMPRDLAASQLAMMRSVVARERGDHANSVAHAEEAARLVSPQMPEISGIQWSMLAAARAGIGDYSGAIEAYQSGFKFAHEQGNLIGAYGCTYGQVMYMLFMGRLIKAEKFCRLAIDGALREGHGNFPAAGWLYITLARIELERYCLDEAEVHLEKGLRIARPGGFNEAQRSGRYLRAHLAAARGDLDIAANIFQDTEKIINSMDESYLAGELSWEWAKLCLKAGDLDAAYEKLRILDEQCAANRHANFLLARRWLFPRLLCAEKRFEETLSALDDSVRHAREVNGKGELIRLLPMQAVAMDALGKHLPARTALREALQIGSSEGYIWRWLDAGPEVAPLLRELENEIDTLQVPQSYLEALLEAFRSEFGGSEQPQPKELLDKLTAREFEIMRLICQGCSNSEIAGKLVVSVNTIKKHTSNIYGKLGVRSRTQAIARAQQLNLV